jgi:hypothetical protein
MADTNKKYRVKEGDESLPANEQTIIKNFESEVEFNFGNVQTDIAYLEKSKKQMVAEIGIKKAILKNIDGTHPHIGKMSQEDLTAAYLYREATGFLNMAEPKIEEIDKQLKDYADEKVEIEKQTGLKEEIPSMLDELNKETK